MIGTKGKLEFSKPPDFFTWKRKTQRHSLPSSFPLSSPPPSSLFSEQLWAELLAAGEELLKSITDTAHQGEVLPNY